MLEKPVLKMKTELGQFMTPEGIARFMASMYPNSDLQVCDLLDAGAGKGALSSAFVDRFLNQNGGFRFNTLNVHTYEIDSSLYEAHREKLAEYSGINLYPHNDDFIKAAAIKALQGGRKFSHAILNPPYKKMNTDSEHRQLVRAVGLETVNLYTAFVALALELLRPHGILVAIIPRSFCNGPYYKPFREFILKRSAIRRIHLFGARDKAFKEDGVLQENIIIMLEREAEQGDIELSLSTDASFSDLSFKRVQFSDVVPSVFDEKFICIPTGAGGSSANHFGRVNASLKDIGVAVSTGPVVDFRLKDFLRPMPGEDTVPLLYPTHFQNNLLHWPLPVSKKPNAIVFNGYTEKWLYPAGTYCVVRRFSSKEEKRRIVANVVESADLPDSSMFGFENHLNVFHINKNGMAKELAYGLSLYLNSTLADEYFREFSGHTQVNATDLRQMKYPTREVLIELGKWVITQQEFDQHALDQQLERLIA